MADFQGSRLRFEGRAPSTISTAYVARWEGPVLERDDPYPHPGRLAGGPARRAPRAGGPVPAVAQQPARERRDQVGRHALRRRGRDDGLRGERLQRGHQRVLLRAAPSSTTTSASSAGTTRIPPAVPAAPARPRRLPHQEQLGHDLRARRLLLDLLLRPLLRDDADGVRRRRGRRQLRRHLPARHARLVAQHRLREHDGVVRRPVHQRRRRQRHRRELLHGQARRDLRGPRRAVAGRGRGGARRGSRHHRRRRVSHGHAWRRLWRSRRAPTSSSPCRLTTPGTRAPIPVEHPTKLLAPRAAAGRSFISRDGAVWTDLQDEVRLRLVRRLPQSLRRRGGRAGTTAPPRVVPRARVGAARAPARASTSRSPTRRSPAAAPWSSCGCGTRAGVSLRVLRVPGAQPSTSGTTWRFAAPRSRGDYRIVARAWDVAGHRSALTLGSLQVR